MCLTALEHFKSSSGAISEQCTGTDVQELLKEKVTRKHRLHGGSSSRSFIEAVHQWYYTSEAS